MLRRMPWTVRPEEPGDAAAVREVHERAFAPSTEEAEIVDALRAAGDLVPELTLVALDAQGRVVGHVAHSRAHVDDAAVLVLAPVAVLPDHQRAGVGSALITEALRRAATTDLPLVSVLGHPAYYPRFGFEPAVPLGIEAPFPAPPEAWMIHRLPGYRPEVRGPLTYAPAFTGP